MKRILAFVLSVCLVYGTFSCIAFAYDEDEGVTAEEPVIAEDIDYTDCFLYRIEDGCAVITGFTGEIADVVIPDELGGCAVTGIADFAFDDCSAEKITVPAAADSIAKDAFRGSKLCEIEVAEGNEAYCSVDGVLYNAEKTVLIKCPRAKQQIAEIPESVIVIGDAAFFESEITEFPACESITAIGDFAFAYSKIKAAPLTDYVTSIGDYAFCGCDALESAVLPKEIGSIPEAAFQGCRSLISVNIPASVNSIGARAFYDSGIKDEIYIPAGVTEIGDYAFGWYFENDVEFVKSEGFTVWGEEGSAAEQFAADNGFGFVNTKLDTPELIEACADNTCVTLYWCGVSRADSYIIYKKTNGGSWKSLAVVGADEDTLYCDFDVDDGNVYTYTVKASMSGYTSLYDKKGVCAEYIKLPTPVMKSASASGRAVKVSWGNIPAAKGFTLYKRTDDTEWSEVAELSAGKTSYTDKSIKAGIKYYYTVTASRGEIVSAYDAKGVSATFYPKAPELSSAKNSTSGVTVKWKASSDADSYAVYRKTSDGSWSKLASVKGGTLSYTDKTVKGGKTYYYSVASVCDGVTGEYNKTGLSCFYIESPVLSIKNTADGIKISWKKCAGAKNYRIYIKNSDGEWQRLGTSKNADITSYNYRNVKNGKKYTFTVKCYNGSYTSINTSATIKYLSAVKVSSATSTKTGITVKWDKNSSASGYYVYRKTGSGSYSKIATVKKAGTVSYVDKSAKKGTTYTYYVKAYNGSYTGTYANTVKCKDKY